MIKIGDIVKLKSGSVRMTVREVNEKQVFCDWYDSTNYRFQMNGFVPQSLELWVPPIREE